MVRRKHRKSRRIAPPPLPMHRTLIGRFLRASMLRQSSESELLSARSAEWSSINSLHVIINAFETAVTRLFEPDADLREISLFVYEMRRAFGPEVPSLETEALIRFILGEDVPIDDIPPKKRTAAMILTLVACRC